MRNKKEKIIQICDSSTNGMTYLTDKGRVFQLRFNGKVYPQTEYPMYEMTDVTPELL